MGGRSKAFILIALVAAGRLAGEAGAEPTSRSVIAGTASAQGIRTTIRSTGFIIEELADGGGPVAQAVVDPQDAKSFASLPYPGDNAVALPGVIAAVGGPTIPAYPFYATASSSAPEQEVADPAGRYRLHTTAGSGSAVGEARLDGGGDPPPSQTRSGAAVRSRGAETTSRAETVVRSLQLGSGALRIGTLQSVSETTYRSDGSDPKTVTELRIEGGTAGPMSFSYGPEGFSVAQQGVPIPSGDALGALNRALAPAGLTIGIARAQDVAGGRSSEALVVEQAGDVANGSRSSVRYRIGEATSAVILGDPLSTPTDSEVAPVVTPGVNSASPSFVGQLPSVASDPPAAPGPIITATAPVVGTVGEVGLGASSGLASPPEPSPPQLGDSTPMLTPPMAEPTPVAAVPVVPRRISATEGVSGLLVAAAAAMVAVALLWTKRGAVTP